MTTLSFTEGSDNGALNGNVAVTVLASPAASTRRLLRSLNISNRDTASVVLTLTFVDGGSSRILVSAMTLAVGDTLIFDEIIALDEIDQSITAVLAGAPATTNPDYVTTWADVT